MAQKYSHLLSSLHLEIVFENEPQPFQKHLRNTLRRKELSSFLHVETRDRQQHHSWHTLFHGKSPVAALVLAPGIPLPFSYEGLQRLSDS